jgi:peptidylprolyl isomerase
MRLSHDPVLRRTPAQRRRPRRAGLGGEVAVGLARSAAAWVAALLLAGCSAFIGTSSAAIPSPAADLDAAVITGAVGQEPTIAVPMPFSTETTKKRVLVHGTGATISAKQRVTIQYVGVNGVDGKTFDTTWTKRPVSFLLTDTTAVKGLVTSLVGARVGDRFAVAIPPADGYGLDGRPAAGIGPTDTIVLVVDVISARTILTQATGAAVAPKAGLPVVGLDAAKHPKITLPAGAPPAALIVQPLITGTGAKVAKGSQVSVQYTGVLWPGGTVFDSSWTRPTASTFTVGTGQLINGWDTGILGQAVGSRVLLVIPPDRGYGAEGSPKLGIKGTDTLVFVVDVLDVA